MLCFVGSFLVWVGWVFVFCSVVCFHSSWPVTHLYAAQDDLCNFCTHGVSTHAKKHIATSVSRCSQLGTVTLRNSKLICQGHCAQVLLNVAHFNTLVLRTTVLTPFRELPNVVTNHIAPQGVQGESPPRRSSRCKGFVSQGSKGLPPPRNYVPRKTGL